MFHVEPLLDAEGWERAVGGDQRLRTRCRRMPPLSRRGTLAYHSGSVFRVPPAPTELTKAE
jgi:hypothetical protein